MHTGTMRKAIVDKSISETQLLRFQRYARKKALAISEYLRVGEHHPGMPDGEILFHLLNDSTICSPAIASFIIWLLFNGLVSYFIDDDGLITGEPLPGIITKRHISFGKKDRTIKEDYMPPTADIRPALLSDSPKWLDKLKTKRRRIRNHFGGLDNLSEVAVTVSWFKIGADTLIGVRVQVSGKAGFKAITGSESYALERLSPQYRGIAAICYAMVLVIQLMLHAVPTSIYFDTRQITDPLAWVQQAPQEPFAIFFTQLRECFPRLIFQTVDKGRHIEMLRSKLQQLALERTNEIVPGNIEELMEKVRNF